MDKLINYLKTLSPGEISETRYLEPLLKDAWNEFSGSNLESMAGWKILNRIENVQWNPPFLSFIIERHGITVGGSTRATLQEWELNLSSKTASCGEIGRRQLYPMKNKLDINPFAEEIAHLIINFKEDVRLKWNNDKSVQILIGKILPEVGTSKQTIEARRKRFRTKVEQLIFDVHWGKIRVNVYRPDYPMSPINQTMS
jgi:hypothetical protein